MQFETTIYINVTDEDFDDLINMYVENETDVETIVDEFIRDMDYDGYSEFLYIEDDLVIELEKRLKEKGLYREDD